MWTIKNLLSRLQNTIPSNCKTYGDLSIQKNENLQSGMFYISYLPINDWEFKVTLDKGKVKFRLVSIDDLSEDESYEDEYEDDEYDDGEYDEEYEDDEYEDEDEDEFELTYHDFNECFNFILYQTRISIAALSKVLQENDEAESDK